MKKQTLVVGSLFLLSFQMQANAGWKVSQIELKNGNYDQEALVEAFDGKFFSKNEYLLGLVRQQRVDSSTPDNLTVSFFDKSGQQIQSAKTTIKSTDSLRVLGNINSSGLQVLLTEQSSWGGGYVLTTFQNGRPLNKFEMESSPKRCGKWGEGDYSYHTYFGKIELSKDQGSLLTEDKCLSYTSSGLSYWLMQPTTRVFDGESRQLSSLDRAESAFFVNSNFLVSRRMMNGTFGDTGADDSYGVYATDLTRALYSPLIIGLEGSGSIVTKMGYPQFLDPAKGKNFPRNIFRVDSFLGSAGPFVGLILTQNKLATFKVFSVSGQEIFSKAIPLDKNDFYDMGSESLDNVVLVDDTLVFSSYNRNEKPGSWDVKNNWWSWKLDENFVQRHSDLSLGGQTVINEENGLVGNLRTGPDNGHYFFVYDIRQQSKEVAQIPIDCPKYTGNDYSPNGQLKFIKTMTKTSQESWAFEASCDYRPLNDVYTKRLRYVFKIDRE
jgi:hypothetical protein